MANTYTTGLRLSKPGLGDAGWGTTVNSGLTDLVDQAVAGQVRVDVTAAGPFVLTLSDGAVSDGRSMFIYAFGTPGGAREIQVPARSNTVNKLFFVRNDSNGAVTVKVVGQTGVVVPVNASMVLKMNDGGTDVVEGITHVAALTLGAPLPVASGGTGITAFGTGVATALGQNVTGSGGIVLATSPTFTGIPAAPTATSGTNTTQLATTAFVQSAIQAAYPVGSIYINATNATNPGTLLGFGTWVAFGAGRVPVGFDSGNPLFDTAEETGGSANATVVSHDHTYSATTGNQSANHTHSPTSGNFLVTGTSPYALSLGSEVAVASSTGTQSADHTHNVSGTTASTGSSGTNANYQPYITVYMWKRTA
jgi:hypothetical protein